MNDLWKPDEGTRKALERGHRVAGSKREKRVRWLDQAEFDRRELERKTPTEVGAAGLDDRAAVGHAGGANDSGCDVTTLTGLVQ